MWLRIIPTYVDVRKTAFICKMGQRVNADLEFTALFELYAAQFYMTGEKKLQSVLTPAVNNEWESHPGVFFSEISYQRLLENISG